MTKARDEASDEKLEEALEAGKQAAAARTVLTSTVLSVGTREQLAVLTRPVFVDYRSIPISAAVKAFSAVAE